ncbi:MAG: rRNA maturation RNase YbeY [Planctomycetota bacterium]
MIKIAFANHQKHLKIDRRSLARLARQVLKEEGVADADLSVTFVDNGKMHELNRTYLAHDYPTDVLTFPLSDDASPLSGEIIISAEYAIGEAAEYGNTPDREVALYLTHGILHLCGYDDRSKGKAKVMAARQEALLEAFLTKEEGAKPNGSPPRQNRR